MTLKYRVIERFQGKYAIVEMCKVFQVSRSGYYAWRKRQRTTPKDQWLVDLIIECQQKCKQIYGCRRVKRWLKRYKGKKCQLEGNPENHEKTGYAFSDPAQKALYALQTGSI